MVSHFRFDLADVFTLSRLFAAAAWGHHAVVGTLLTADAHSNIADSVCSATALFEASACGFSEICKQLLGAGAFVNSTTDEGMSPLMAACRYGHVNVVEVLLQHEADLDIQDVTGLCAMHYSVSAMQDSIVIMELLLGAGADIDLSTVAGATSLMLAVKQCDEAKVTLRRERVNAQLVGHFLRLGE